MNIVINGNCSNRVFHPAKSSKGQRNVDETVDIEWIVACLWLGEWNEEPPMIVSGSLDYLYINVKFMAPFVDINRQIQKLILKVNSMVECKVIN